MGRGLIYLALVVAVTSIMYEDLMHLLQIVEMQKGEVPCSQLKWGCHLRVPFGLVDEVLEERNMTEN